MMPRWIKSRRGALARKPSEWHGPVRHPLGGKIKRSVYRQLGLKKRTIMRNSWWTEKEKCKPINQQRWLHSMSLAKQFDKRWVPAAIHPERHSDQQEVNPLAFFVPTRWTERANKRQMILESKRDSESSLSTLWYIKEGGNTCRERWRLLTFESNEWQKVIEDFLSEKLWEEWWKKTNRCRIKQKGSREIKRYVSSGIKQKCQWKRKILT